MCRLCGNERQLSFEHVPPKAAFNDRRYIKVALEDTIGLGPDEIVKGPIKQGGIGDYTLCIKCNSDTGAWYGGRFVDWCYQAMEILIRSNGNPTLVYLNYLFPLPILKQIVAMFFSVNDEHFAAKHPELVRFVLDKERNHLPPIYRFFVYYNLTGRFRYSGVSARIQLDSNAMPGSNAIVMSEITYPPFGYLLTFNSAPPDNRLVEITHFADCRYDEFRVMTLKLPVLPTHLAYPGDYRTREEINEQAARSKGEETGDP